MHLNSLTSQQPPRRHHKAVSILTCVLLCALVQHVYATDATEHRWALLIDASSDSAQTAAVNRLDRSLRSKGFVVTRLDAKHPSSAITYEEWLRSVPTMSASIIYYCGRFDTVKSNDGKRTLFAMQLRGHRELAPIVKPTGRERPPQRALTLARLGASINRHTARHLMLAIDCLGFDDHANTKLSLPDLVNRAQGAARGRCHTYFYPGKNAFHPSLPEPKLEAVLAGELADAFEKGSDLPDSLGKLAHKSIPRDQPNFVLKRRPAEICSPPSTMRTGRFAGDQWVDRFGINYVWCPPGKFMMGDAAYDDAQPVEVTISQGFWIGKFELLAGEPVPVGGGPSVSPRAGDGKGYWLPRSAGQLFTNCIPNLANWQAHIRDKGLGYAGWSYDIPTEAEWEYASRAGTKTAFPCPTKELGQHGNFADLSLYNDRGHMPYLYAHQEANDGYGRSVADVGQYKPNAWGIHDMRGNLAELCADIYNDSLLGGVDPLDLRFKLDRGFRSLPSARGGAWCSPASYLHPAHRNPRVGLRQTQGLVPLAVDGIRLIIRQGDRRSRSADELMAAQQAAQEDSK